NDTHSPIETGSAWYEDYTSQQDVTVYFNPALYPSYNGGVIPSFATAREFWTRPPIPGPRYLGMADFTSYNYVSFGTAFQVTKAPNGTATIQANGNFPLPASASRDGTPYHMESITGSIALMNGSSLSRTIDYVVGNVYD